jgi:DNA processing protein
MTLPQDQRQSWLALYMIPGLGNVVLRRLFEKFLDVNAIFEAGFFDLMGVEGLRKGIARKILDRELLERAEKEILKAERSGAKVLTYQDPAYPVLLREIHNPPMVLFVKGLEIPLEQTFVGLVGSRNPTHYGLKATERISMALAKRGAGVVSGLARGIDASAHGGCLRAEGFTIGVLGTGIDVVYPKSNRKLFDQMVEEGVVLSEFPMGTAPEPRNFPIRNRVISGLSRGVAVIEATRKSGSLITAALALEQNREIFAVPGSIDSFKSTGTHWLIKQCARLIENADDILDELWFLKQGAGVKKGHEPPLPKGKMDGVERSIYDIIGNYPIHIDQIARTGAMDAGQVAMILLKMELNGTIRQLPGKMYVRC